MAGMPDIEGELLAEVARTVHAYKVALDALEEYYRERRPGVTANAIVALEARMAADGGDTVSQGLIEGLRDGTIYAERDGKGEFRFGLSEWLRE